MPNIALPNPSFILINSESELPGNMGELTNSLTKTLSKNVREAAVGLGILDIYEYYFEMNLTEK